MITGMGNWESDGGYDRTLRYERNKISAGYDHTFTFGTWKSYLNWNETENKGRELVRSVLKRDKWGLAGQPRELKESNLILNSLLLTLWENLIWLRWGASFRARP